MGTLAVTVGQFLGAVLAQLAPVLITILSEAIKRAHIDTVELSKFDSELAGRLNTSILRYKNGASTERPTGVTSGAGQS